MPALCSLNQVSRNSFVPLRIVKTDADTASWHILALQLPSIRFSESLNCGLPSLSLKQPVTFDQKPGLFAFKS